MKSSFYVLLTLLVFGGVAFAADPDFSGGWALEQENGFAYGKPFMNQSPEADDGILITHTQDSLLMESDCVACGTQAKEYILDGRTRNLPNDKGALISYSAKMDGDLIVIDQGFGGPTPFGSAVVVTRISLSLSQDNEVLTIYSSSKDLRGEVIATKIFKRIH
jgi:hypothetical protein